MCRRIVVIAAALCAVLALSGVGDALAAQGDTPPPLGLRSIGAAPDITFAGQQAQVSVSIPVPQNLTPDKLSGFTDVPPFVTGGTVDVLQGDRVISRTPINPAPNSPIELPLAGVRVTRNAADITLRAYLTVSGICQFDPDNAFHIRDTTLSFTGREAIPEVSPNSFPRSCANSRSSSRRTRRVPRRRRPSVWRRPSRRTTAPPTSTSTSRHWVRARSCRAVNRIRSNVRS